MPKLELGYHPNFEVRRVAYPSAGAPFSVLYLSDLHLTRWGGPLVERLVATIARLAPHLVLLGGDYVDGRRSLPHFARLLRALAGRPHVFVVAGNHDAWFGLPELRRLVESHQCRWLAAGEAAQVELAGRRIQVSSRADGPAIGADVDFNLGCLHAPAGPGQPPAHHLLFAGHLHGGQVVLWRSAAGGLYPGRLVYRWNILQAWRGQCLVLVSKGLGDTLPVRYNCPKDVVLVTVGPAESSPS